jgi:hypothetical protein
MTNDRRASDAPADAPADVPADGEATCSVGGPTVTWREVDGEIVVLDLDGSVYFGVNGAGAALWKQLAGGADRNDLTATLVARDHLSATTARADVDTFLAELDRWGLLHHH